MRLAAVGTLGLDVEVVLCRKLLQPLPMPQVVVLPATAFGGGMVTQAEGGWSSVHTKGKLVSCKHCDMCMISQIAGGASRWYSPGGALLLTQPPQVGAHFVPIGARLRHCMALCPGHFAHRPPRGSATCRRMGLPLPVQCLMAPADSDEQPDHLQCRCMTGAKLGIDCDAWCRDMLPQCRNVACTQIAGMPSSGSVFCTCES